MGQRLRVVAWLRFGSRAQLDQGLHAFAASAASAASAAPVRLDESVWNLDGLDARLALDTALPDGVTGVEPGFMAMLLAATSGYVDYLEQGNTQISQARGNAGPLKRWAVGHIPKKRQLITASGTMGLRYPGADTSIRLAGSYGFATEQAARAAVAAPIRLPYLTPDGVRELRLEGAAIVLEGTRVSIEAAIEGPWEQLQEPLLEALQAISRRASSGTVRLRGAGRRHAVSARAKLERDMSAEPPAAPDLVRLTPVDPALVPVATPPAAATHATTTEGASSPARSRKKAAVEAPVALEPPGGVQGALVLSDGRLLTWGDTQVTLWSLPAGAPLHTSALASPDAGGSRIAGAFELPGGRVAIRHDGSGALELLDPRTYIVRPLQGPEHSPVLGVTVEGERLVSWSLDGTVRTWSLEGEEQRTIRVTGQGAVSQLTGLGDGTLIAIASQTGQRLDVVSGQRLEELGPRTAVHRLDGSRYLLENQGAFELRGGRPLAFTLEPGPHAVRVVDPDRLVLSAHRSFHVLSLVDGAIDEVDTGHRKAVQPPIALGEGLWASHARSMPGLDERFGFDGMLRVWSADDRWRPLAEHDARAPIRQALALPGGRLALLLDDAVRGKEITILEARTGQPVATVKGARKAVVGLLELPDRRLVSWSKDRSARLFALPAS